MPTSALPRGKTTTLLLKSESAFHVRATRATTGASRLRRQSEAAPRLEPPIHAGDVTSARNATAAPPKRAGSRSRVSLG
jgi:hypothetical protein